MKIRIDPARCDGYANCVIEADEVFEIDDESGQASVRRTGVPAELAEAVRRAEASCPAQAILVED
ncbi:ferredoxin [Amycolatopsis sp. NPDC051061]|uniref:ferredoxin n=1 Tax=Amycolatopsis sp. NPDC051061 TaxID=3155042 RepID=UPI003434A38E